MKTRIITYLFTTLCSFLFAVELRAQSTAFTYQGRLNDGTAPANGSYDLTFSVFGGSSGGSTVGGPLTNSATAVSNGLFTVLIDFGAGVFNGDPRWLEIAVRPAGGGTFTILNPRQPVSPAPYAIFAANAGNAATASNVVNGAVVKSVNNLRDNVTLAAGANVTITPSGNTLTIGASGINPWQTSGGNIFYNDGRVGIGLSAPTARLEVNAPAVGDGVKLRGIAPGYSLSDAAGIPRATLGYASSAGLYSTDASAGDSVLRSETGKLLLQNGSLGSALALNNNQVGIGTPTPQAKLDVRGDIRLGQNGQFRATSGEENLRIVRGVVGGSGNIIVGSGFQVTRLGSGFYDITFNTPFAGAPTVTATTQFSNSKDVTILLGSAGVTASAFTFVIRDIDAGFTDPYVDAPFHFIAIGPR